MKKIVILLVTLFLLIPLNISALNKSYNDLTHEIVGEKTETNNINTKGK